jgi:peroxiredoxin
MSLSHQLDQLTARLRAMVPAERFVTVDRFAEELVRSGQADRALKAGDHVVIVFYRGRWCAYCNAQLSALQEIHQQIAAISASLIAISPQTQKHSYMTRDMHKLRFPVLSDAGNQVARKFGLVYRLSPELQAMYESIMTKLPGYNGDQSWELPLAATYAVQSDGKISSAQIDADWRHRPEPEEILQIPPERTRTNQTA